MKIALKWTLCLVLGVIGLTTFTSCDDDDDAPKAPEVTDVYGDYSGKMEYVLLNTGKGREAAKTPSVDVTAKINNDTITFAEFPIESLVVAIVGEEAAAGIIDQIGKSSINYEIGYVPTLNAANDTVAMKLDPKPIEIPLGEKAKISISVAVVEEGAYSVEKKNTSFELKATVPLLLEDGISLKFNLNKK